MCRAPWWRATCSFKAASMAPPPKPAAKAAANTAVKFGAYAVATRADAAKAVLAASTKPVPHRARTNALVALESTAPAHVTSTAPPAASKGNPRSERMAGQAAGTAAPKVS